MKEFKRISLFIVCLGLVSSQPAYSICNTAILVKLSSTNDDGRCNGTAKLLSQEEMGLIIICGARADKQPKQ